MDQAAGAARCLRRWRDDPVAFEREEFQVEPDPWQLDALTAFPRHERLAMKACKGPGKTAVLVPRPRINLLLYHGVLAAHAAWRAEVVPRAPSGVAAPGASAAPDAAAATSPGPAGRRWADLMRRAF